VTDVRAAEQISGLFVLPLVALFIGQATGLFLVDTTLILWMTAALLAIDTVLMILSIRLFQRESILTKWK
jgi:ABC-2 type transport system permease protein